MFNSINQNVDMSRLDSQQRYIWNAALEAAIKAADNEGDYNPASYYIEAIRKLKK